MKILIIGGPTATGKTSLAIAAAQRFGGEVVSADSMQVYRGMDIGTAKPTMAERRGVRHVMLDEVEPTAPFSVADYCARARTYIEEMAARGVVPIVAGGTGLYIRALIDNVDFAACDVDYAYRAALRQQAAEQGSEVLHKMLLEIDPASAAAIHPNNVKRIVRALECYHTTGRTKTELDAQALRRPPLGEAMFAALTMDRAALYARIDARVDDMLARGLLAEVESLRAQGLRADDISMQGIGYKELLAHLDGQMPLDESVALIKQKSRNYAKRQLTWFRRDDRYQWYDAADPSHTAQFLEAAARFLVAPVG